MARLSLISWWRRRHRGPWHVSSIVYEADLIPRHLPSTEAVLVGTASNLKWVVFDCPCGRGHRIMLNLSSSRWPRWTVHRESPLTLWPSVDVVVDNERCHYVIDNGRVDWVRNLYAMANGPYREVGR